jgi:hypothetical protein
MRGSLGEKVGEGAFADVHAWAPGQVVKLFKAGVPQRVSWWEAVAIADEVVRSLIPGKRLRYLTCNPFCRRICCDVDPDEVSAVEPDNDEGIEQVETDSWNNEQVHGGDVRRVVTRRAPSPQPQLMP